LILGGVAALLGTGFFTAFVILRPKPLQDRTMTVTPPAQASAAVTAAPVPLLAAGQPTLTAPNGLSETSQTAYAATDPVGGNVFYFAKLGETAYLHIYDSMNHRIEPTVSVWTSAEALRVRPKTVFLVPRPPEANDRVSQVDEGQIVASINFKANLQSAE
jgi:hypothetical protein